MNKLLDCADRWMQSKGACEIKKKTLQVILFIARVVPSLAQSQSVKMCAVRLLEVILFETALKNDSLQGHCVTAKTAYDIILLVIFSKKASPFFSPSLDAPSGF